MTRPSVEVLGQDSYLLTEDYTYQWQANGFTWRINCRSGFEFDGASIPPFVNSFVGKWELGIGPPLVHDYLYYYKGNLPKGDFQFRKDGHWVNDTRTWGRDKSDKLFCRHARKIEIPKFRRRAAYLVIRGLGWYSWYLCHR